jgi:hypothetical protein
VSEETRNASDGRPQPPSSTATKQSLDDVKEIFPDNYANATTPHPRASLARQLIAQSEKIANPRERRALLNEAMSLASAAGDVNLSFESIDLPAKRLAIDGDELKLESVTKLATTPPPPELGSLTQAVLTIAHKASDTDNNALPLKRRSSPTRHGIVHSWPKQ